MKTNVSISALLVLIAATAYSHAQSAYRGIMPGTSTKAQAERVLGSPAKAVSATLSEYAGTSEVDKIYVQYRADSSVVERIELLYGEGVSKGEIVAKFKLPTESAWKVNARGNVEEYYSGRNIVLTFEGEDKSGGVRRVGHYSPELFATVLPSGETKPVGNSADKGPTRTSVTGMPEPPAEWMRAIPIGESNTMITRKDPDRDSTRTSVANADLDAYVGIYEFRAASTPAGLATGSVEVDRDRLVFKSRYINGVLVRSGSGTQLDKDGVTMKKFAVYRFADNENVRLSFTIDNGRVLEVAFSDLSPGKSITTMGFRRY